MKTFKQENDDLVASFLNHTYLKSWKEKMPSFSRLELELGTACNLACKYCYYHKYGEQLFPAKIQNPEIAYKNLGIMLDWLIKNGYSPEIDFFSGEPFFQEIGFDCLKLILDKFKSASKKPKNIVVPTNYTFLLSKEKTKKVENLLSYAKKVGIPMFLSASFDGKYCEGNRPLRTGEEIRDDEYYNKCFAFNKKWNFGFHPMIYSELIGNWKRNFLWFQDNLKKLKIPYWSLYLLEVRNVEWTQKQLKDFMDFLDFLMEWMFKTACNNDKEAFANAVLQNKVFNILSGPFVRTNRGLGCSVQTTMQLRLGDLSIVPCHRTSYRPYIEAKFKVKNNEIVGIEGNNPETMIGITTLEGNCLPFCETCPIKYICTKGCLGSQFETTGDMFSPIPTVCKLEHSKIISILSALRRLNLYDMIYSRLDKNQKLSLDTLEELSAKEAYHGHA
jgi:radical SAM protein with 4Fe4S-binding SPASM domain